MGGRIGKEDWKRQSEIFQEIGLGRCYRPGGCNQSAGYSSRNEFHHGRRAQDDLRPDAGTVPKDARTVPNMLHLTRSSHPV